MCCDVVNTWNVCVLKKENQKCSFMLCCLIMEKKKGFRRIITELVHSAICNTGSNFTDSLSRTMMWKKETRMTLRHLL